MTIYIRVDMNSTIATGHLMRCLSVAREISKTGNNVTFITSDLEGEKEILENQYTCIVLGSDWRNKESEIDQMIQLIRQYTMEVLLIDSYQVTEKYLLSLHKYTKIYYIDDLNMFHYSVDGLICYANYFRKFNYDGQYKGKTNLLLGTQFVPLREEFKNMHAKKISNQIQKLLVLSGGGDPNHFVLKFLKNLDLEQYEKVDVICGRYFLDYEDGEKRYKGNKKVHLHRCVSHIETYMREADVAISAGGTTLYELCACGVPTITYSFADNQIDNVKQFESDQIMKYAGDVRTESVICNILELLNGEMAQKSIRKSVSKRMQAMIDGQGSWRIAKALLEV